MISKGILLTYTQNNFTDSKVLSLADWIKIFLVNTKYYWYIYWWCGGLVVLLLLSYCAACLHFTHSTFHPSHAINVSAVSFLHTVNFQVLIWNTNFLHSFPPLKMKILEQFLAMSGVLRRQSMFQIFSLFLFFMHAYKYFILRYQIKSYHGIIKFKWINITSI